MRVAVFEAPAQSGLPRLLARDRAVARQRAAQRPARRWLRESPSAIPFGSPWRDSRGTRRRSPSTARSSRAPGSDWRCGATRSSTRWSCSAGPLTGASSTGSRACWSTCGSAAASQVADALTPERRQGAPEGATASARLLDPQRRGREERVEAHAGRLEGGAAALLAVDDAEQPGDLEPGVAQLVDRLQGGAARRDDVLDDDDPLSASARPSIAFFVPYSFSPLRTMTNGFPLASDSAATIATAPSSGPASRSNGSWSGELRRQARRRCRPAGRGASRTGTCRGRSGCAARSAG